AAGGMAAVNRSGRGDSESLRLHARGDKDSPAGVQRTASRERASSLKAGTYKSRHLRRELGPRVRTIRPPAPARFDFPLDCAASALLAQARAEPYLSSLWATSRLAFKVRWATPIASSGSSVAGG